MGDVTGASACAAASEDDPLCAEVGVEGNRLVALRGTPEHRISPLSMYTSDCMSKWAESCEASECGRHFRLFLFLLFFSVGSAFAGPHPNFSA